LEFFNNLRNLGRPKIIRCAQNCAQILRRQQRNHVIKVLVAEVSVDLCRPYRLVSQELLYRTDVTRSHHEVARERVPPGVQARVFNSKPYQLLTYTDDVDLNKELAEWERFYYLDRPHGAFKGKTPYEALRCMLE